jgi:hypothetical protein
MNGVNEIGRMAGNLSEALEQPMSAEFDTSAERALALGLQAEAKLEALTNANESGRRSEEAVPVELAKPTADLPAVSVDFATEAGRSAKGLKAGPI